MSDIIIELFSCKFDTKRIGYVRIRGEDVLAGEVDDVFDLQMDANDKWLNILFPIHCDRTITGQVQVLVLFGDEEPFVKKAILDKTLIRSKSVVVSWMCCLFLLRGQKLME